VTHRAPTVILPLAVVDLDATPETATADPENAKSIKTDLRKLGQRIARLHTRRPDLRPRLDDDRPRLPAPAELLRQLDANDLDAMVDAAFREYEDAVPVIRDAPIPVIRDAPIPVIRDAPIPVIRDAAAIASNVTSEREPAEVDIGLDAALLDFVCDARTPSNDAEPAPCGRYAYVNQGAMRPKRA
jgi:hypothetical protein